MSQAARCATHPDALAEASCARCGDFVCRLCTPLEPLALCAVCAVRCTVDWEERGELGLARAFWGTLRESFSGPTRLGRKLGGAGHLMTALHFAALCALCGLLPLSLVAAVPLMAWADASRLGLESTGVFGVAVSLVLGALVASTLFAVGALLAAAWLWLWARAFGVRVRVDVLVRALAYGTGPVALPLLGPLLWPSALLWSALSAYGALRGRAAGFPALAALVGAAFGSLAFGAFGWWWLSR